ncbi:1-deoxy-D-xylulose-5-phosphate synthase N-terminal domain-containing protein [Nocardia sp. NPDC050793]|uniref:1-deoxy-D-xylulose-5-phosphate synthase N-terminal domain-containing protein n=1 Tax=Nocardia sp. NPDC050793 TaxID=3155159 RepID=UPI0033C39A2B
MTSIVVNELATILERQALRCREVVIDTAATEVGCHLGGSLSVVEILLATMAIADTEEGSAVVLSKGHAAAALYAALHVRGVLSEHPAVSYGRAGSALTGHPGKDMPGVLFPTGSLGHGAAYAVGWALSRRLLARPGRTFAIVGDGELQEGLVWEALQVAAAKKVDDLTLIVDANGGQNDGYVADISPLGDLAARLRAFGAVVETVDGHSVPALLDALTTGSGLRAIVARTTKAKGVSTAEGLSKSHYVRIGKQRAHQWKSALAGVNR